MVLNGREKMTKMIKCIGFLFVLSVTSCKSEEGKKTNEIQGISIGIENCYETILIETLVKASREGIIDIPDTLYYIDEIIENDTTMNLNFGNVKDVIVTEFPEDLLGEKTVIRIEYFENRTNEVNVLLQDVLLVEGFQDKKSIIKSGIGYSLNAIIDIDNCGLTISDTFTIEY